MIRFARSSSALFAFTTCAAALAGCGSSDDEGPASVASTGGASVVPSPSGGTPGAGGATGTTGGTAPVGNGGTTPVGNGGTTPIGSGGTTPIGSGGTAPVGSGGAGAGGTGPISGNIDPATGKLIPPAAGQGIQLATAKFQVNPGQEVFKCFHVTLPVDSPVFVSRFESLMSKGSHHFILYRADSDTTPSGTLTNGGCTLGFDQRWVYTSGSPHNWLDMPKGVAMELGTRQRVVFDMHYSNTSDEVIDAEVVLNVNYAQGEFQKAAALVSFNRTISIPPNGQQTVKGDCTPPPGAKFFLMSTHTHKQGVLATITRKSALGQLIGDPIVKTTDWEHPDAKVLLEEPFVTFAAGEKFEYSCSYVNKQTRTVTVGDEAERDEMCMAVTYYFPAATGGRCN